MDLLARLNAAVRYIEKNLDGEIDGAEIAKQTAASIYHFYNLFSSLTGGISISEYIRI